MEITHRLWNAARAAVRASRIIEGDGIRIARGANGTTISSSVTSQNWPSPFRCSLNGSTQVSILPGLVNGEMPLLPPSQGGTPTVYLDGTNQDGSTAQGGTPTLNFGAQPDLDPIGRGYLALQFTCDDKWALIPSTLTVVQCAYYDSLDGKTYPDGAGGPATLGGVPGLPGRMVRYPLAMMRKSSTGTISFFQNVTGGLNHRADPRGDDVARHFFWGVGPGASPGPVSTPTTPSTS